MKIPKYLKDIFFAIPIGLTIGSVGYILRVDGISMPLNPHNTTIDYVFFSRWAVRSHKVCRGDVISLISPNDPDQKIVKRIVGLQGDIIATLGYKSDIVQIPKGHCWIEGDHMGHSMDSNHFGPVSIGLITAKAMCILWPPSRWQCLQAFVPESRKPLNAMLRSV